MTQTLAVHPQTFDYYNYYVMCNYVIEEPKPVIQEGYTYEENSVLYCTSATEKGVYCYMYCANSPIMYVDPNGESMKWWQGLLIGLGVDMLMGGAISATAGLTAMAGTTTAGLAAMGATTCAAGVIGFPVSSVSAIGSTVYTTGAITGMVASSILSPIDFFVSAGRAIGGNSQPLKNWWNITLAQFASFATMFSYDRNASGFEWPMQVINSLPGGEILQDYVGKTLGHALNIGGKIEASGFYEERLILRTAANTINSGISFGHYVYGDGIALNPYDWGYNIDLFAHEFGHTYQSRITGPLYLFRYGLSSALFQGSTEDDADWRASQNLGIDPWGNVARHSLNASRYKWYEFFGASILWPFMWSWNK